MSSRTARTWRRIRDILAEIDRTPNPAPLPTDPTAVDPYTFN